MIAAVYVRKSTEQIGVAAEQSSIARQIDHARQYAERKGWMVDDASGCSDCRSRSIIPISTLR